MAAERQHTAAPANPSPLGLLGFGMTTVLLNLHNSGVIPLSIVIISMGFAVGGAAQIIAGIMEFRNGSTFGATAFTAYGFFWWSLIIIWINPFGDGFAANGTSVGFYLLLWAIFSFFMFLGTLKHNHTSQIVFLSLVLLFLLLALGDFTGIHTITVVAGVVGIFCGLAAIYNSVAQIVNQEYGRNVFPL